MHSKGGIKIEFLNYIYHFLGSFMSTFICPMHRLAYVRHAFGLLSAGSTPLHVVICVVFVLYVISRNLKWTYAHLLKGTYHRMPKGIFCMAKNLTEVIGNIDMHHDQRKEFYVVTLYKGKILNFINFFLIFNFTAICCLLLSQKSRYTGCPKKKCHLWKIVTEGHWVELE